MSLVGLPSMPPTDHMNLKHENSPHSVSTISSPSGMQNFSPNQPPNVGNNGSNASSSSTGVGSGGYQVNGVSPIEGSTASGYYNSGSIGGPSHPAASTSTPTPGNGEMINLNKNDDDDLSMINPMNFHASCVPGTSSYSSISPSKMPPTTAFPSMNTMNMPPNCFPNYPSQPTLVVRNPFEDDEPMRIPHSAPPIPQPPQPTLQKYQQIQMFCPDMILSPQKLVDQGRRIPYAWNTARLPMPYPGVNDPRVELYRSQPYPPFGYPPMMNPMMHPRFPGMFPPGMPGQAPHQPAPAPPPAKKSKKDSRAAKAAANAAAQAQAQAQAAAQAAAQAQVQAHTPNFASPDPMRPPSQDVFKVPNLKSPQELKQRLQTPPNGQNPTKSRSPQNRKTPNSALSGFPSRRCLAGNCALCMGPISPMDEGLFCTGFGQGCSQPYHAKCAMLEREAFDMILSDDRYEWICSRCTETKKYAMSYIM